MWATDRLAKVPIDEQSSLTCGVSFSIGFGYKEKKE
jgi:hypothetical protein